MDEDRIEPAPEDRERSASLTLDEIREGSLKLLATIHRRMMDLDTAIAKAEFSRAQALAGDLYQKLAPLAMGETALGSLVRASIIRAEEAQVGMHIGSGKIVAANRDDHDCGGQACQHEVVVLRWEDGTEHRYATDAELLVRNAEDEE